MVEMEVEVEAAVVVRGVVVVVLMWVRAQDPLVVS